MKQTDFDRLKAVCKQEGFELCYEWPTDGDNLFVVQKAKERVEISLNGFDLQGHKTHESFHVEFYVYNSKGFDPKSKAVFLASKLEEYLNKE